MKRIKIALMLVENNDYQAEQEKSARAVARQLDVDLEVRSIEHDAVMQSQTVIQLLQRSAETRPDGILFEPVGTALAQAARMAMDKGVGWVVLNRRLDYASDLRRQFPAGHLFSVTTSHDEVGRIQGEQMAQLLPNGGPILYITGPADNEASKQRTAGMQRASGTRFDARMLKGTWSEQSAYAAVTSFLKLSTSRDTQVRLVAAQNDAMALGARMAFSELPSGDERDRCLKMPFLGCDGLVTGGQAAVKKGILTATVVIPPNAGQAIEALVASLRGGSKPPECIYTVPLSFPQLVSLKAVAS
jgi:ribose transport system substrate-binding protein